MLENSENQTMSVVGEILPCLLLMKPQICTKIKEIIIKQLVQNFLVELG